MRGRVGDSPIIGAGLWTMKSVLLQQQDCGRGGYKKLGAFFDSGNDAKWLKVPAACKEAIMLLVIPNHKRLRVGYIALTKNGSIGLIAHKPDFQYV